MQADAAVLFHRQVQLLWLRRQAEIESATDRSISSTIMRFGAAGHSRSSPLYNAVASLVEGEAEELTRAWVEAAASVAMDAGGALTSDLAQVVCSGIEQMIETWLEGRAPVLFARLERLGSGAPCRPIPLIVAATRTMAERECEIVRNAARLREQLRGGTDPVRTPIEEAGDMAPRAFLCHSSQDDGFVNRLARDLHAAGVRVFNDEWEIRPGDSLIERISEGIAGCDVFVAVLSPASLASKWVREELNAATIQLITTSARLIPVMLERCQPPPLLAHRAWADFADYGNGLKDLIDAIFVRDRAPALGPPPAFTSYAPPRVPGLTATDEAVLSHLVKASEDALRVSFATRSLAPALGIDPQDIADSVAVLGEKGLLSVLHAVDTDVVEATPEAFLAVRHHLGYDPEDDISRIATALKSLGDADGQRLQEATGIGPCRIARAVRYLEQRGLAEVRRSIDPNPSLYGFVEATATVQLRRQLG